MSPPALTAVTNANIGITLDTYSHVRPGLHEAAATRFDELLSPRRENEAIENVG